MSRIARLSAAVLLPLFALTLLGHLAGRAATAAPQPAPTGPATTFSTAAMFIENVGQFADDALWLTLLQPAARPAPDLVAPDLAPRFGANITATD